MFLLTKSILLESNKATTFSIVKDFKLISIINSIEVFNEASYSLIISNNRYISISIEEIARNIINNTINNTILVAFL